MKGCRFEREILLPEARFTTARFVDCSVPRLEAARVHTEGDLHLPRCRFHNGVRLTDAHIGTDLLMNQAIAPRPQRPFDRRGRHDRGPGPPGRAPGVARRAEPVQRHRPLSPSLRGARLNNPYTRLALNAPQPTVERTLYLTPAGVGASMLSGATPARGTRIQRFECQGGVRLDDGRFGDAVDLERARFTFTDEQELSLRRIQAPELRFLGEKPQRGKVVLSGARVANLVDRATAWPGPGNLHMGGFVYENLVPHGPFPLAERLEWVAAATAEYNPEPYERLAAVLRAGGEDEDAREVLLAKQRRRRETLPPAAKFWGYVQDWTVAYGYRPGRAAVWMAVLWAASSVAFAHASHPPLKGGDHPAWNPALFALDLLLPVIDLGQVGFWQLSGGWQWLAAVMVLLGWILATTVAAGATRLLRRN
ncbi:Oxidoreductase OS=Streptomyces griseorubiginosus OX=67304 GN=AQJ54_11110 PE=4 SV=1 [Streptomyces griseorubiginosus]